MANIKMNYTIITGTGGFLGKAVIEQLKKHDVYMLTPSSKELNLTNQSAVLNYFDIYRPKTVLHMAGYCGGLGLNKKYPADLTHINLKMAVNLFDAIEKYMPEYVYTIGTICSYPEHCPTPFKEDDIWGGFPESTNAGYGLSKKMLYMLQKEYRKQYGLKGAHLVPVNMIGENDNFNPESSHVVAALIKKFIEAKESSQSEVHCFGTGEASREFLYVKDCAEAIVNTLINKIDYPDPINLGTGKSILIKDLAHLISELVEYKGNIVFTGEVGDGQPKRQLDVSRAKQVLGFEAKTDLRTALKNTIKWYVDNRNKI